MSLPPEISQREFYKFRDTGDPAETKVAIHIESSDIPIGGSGSGASQADKSAFVEGTTEFNPIGGVYNETAAGDPAEDEAAAARITAKRALHVNLRKNDGTEHVGQEAMADSIPVAIASNQTVIPVNDNGGSLTVDGTVAATQSGTWVLGANDGVDIGDVTVNNGSGGSAVNIQDGGNTITVDGTVAATQSGTWVLGANSGVDIGDVTVNNAAGASAVNIQDGGNSITVDGTVAATQSGTWNITNISGTVSLPTGAATLAEQQTQSGILGEIATAVHEGSTELVSFIPSGGRVASDVPDLVSAGNGEAVALTTRAAMHVNIRDMTGNDISVATTDFQHTGNSALVQGVPIMGQLDDTSTASVTENNVSPVRITSARGLHVNPRNSSGTEMFNSGANAGFTKLYDGSGTWNVAQAVVSVAGFGMTPTLLYDASLNNCRVANTGELFVRATASANTLATSNYIKGDSDGVIWCSPAAATKTSYSTATTGLAIEGTPTDVWEITGSGTKTIKITKVGISGTAATAVTVDVALIKRSTANSSGTSSATTMVPHDSNNAAATATGKAYTADPTLGTGVGTIRVMKLFLPLTSTASAAGEAMFEFGVTPAQPIVLRGTAQQLCVNFGGATISTGSISIYCEFTEE